MTLSMRGTGLDGGGVGETAKQDLSFTENDAEGGLYYWAASSGGIARYDFGLRGQKRSRITDRCAQPVSVWVVTR